MLKEISIINSIKVLANGILEIQRADIILKDDTEIARSYHRWTLNPGSDLTDQDEKVIAIANITWTPEVIKNYKQSLEEIK